ncbi:MAG: DUF5724 domain-containing protein [Mariniblastus sp.]
MAKKVNFEEQLEQWQVSESDEDIFHDRSTRVVPGLKKLPAKLRAIGMSVFKLDQSGEELNQYFDNEADERKQEAKQKRAAKDQLQFDKLSATDRKKIFATVGKNIGPHLESAWQFLITAPYKLGYERSPFRASKNPELTIESRVDWLCEFTDAIADYKPEIVDAAWLAAWAKHALDYNAECVSPILIGAMNTKGKIGDEVFDVLYKTITRDHPIGVMTGFVIESLMGSNRVEGWEIVEKTLIAAKRQEGLRQVIIENADLAHPDAFKRILKLIIDENLIRFSSVARSVDIWLRLMWDSSSTKVLQENVEAVLQLQNPKNRKKALTSSDAETVYRALWVSASEDAPSTVKLAKSLLKNKSEEIRFVAVWILNLLSIPTAAQAASSALSDENLQIAVLAAHGVSGMSGDSQVQEMIEYTEESENLSKNYFEELEKLYLRLPEKPQTLKAIVWPWTERKIKRTHLADQLLLSLGDRSPTRMLPYMKSLDSWSQVQVVRQLSKQKKWDALTRKSLFELAGSTSANVRGEAYEAFEKKKLTQEECIILEGYLTRTAVDLRTGVVAMLLGQPDKKALESAERLLAAKNSKLRSAGLEMVRQLCEADRLRKECKLAAQTYRTNHKKISKDDLVQLAAIEDSDKDKLSMDNALGLMNPEGLSAVKQPKKQKLTLISKAAIECLKSLDALVHKNRDVSVRYKSWNGWEEEPLGAIDYGLPSLNPRKPLKKQVKDFPLWDTWVQWRDNRPAKLRDKDGLELLRALAATNVLTDEYNYDEVKDFIKKPAQKKIAKAVLGEVDSLKLKYENVVSKIVDWMFYSEIPKGSYDFLLDCKENTAANVTDGLLQDMLTPNKTKRNSWDRDDLDWRDETLFSVWPELFRSFVSQTNIKISAAQQRRDFEVDRFWDRPIPEARRARLPFFDWINAYQKKYATYDDLVDGLLGPGRDEYSPYRELAGLTANKLGKRHEEALAKTKGLQKLVDTIRELLLEIELGRGEKATVSTDAVLAIESFQGSETLFRILKSLDGKFKVLSGWNSSTSDSRPATLTELVRNTYPAKNETAKEFIKLAKKSIADGHVTQDQMLELAFLAPQWSKFVGEFLNWTGFSEGLYWFLAHMNTWMSDATTAAATAEGLDDDPYEEDDDALDDDDDAQEQPEKLSAWERLILERTPLKPEERHEGAVDVDWFHRTFALLGEKRWKQMAQSAKLAANSAQAKKAQFLADVLLGNTPRKDLVDGIKKRNLKENVRLLGLLPLAKGAKSDKDILERYNILLDYKKYARKLSSLTKPDAMRALEIGMSNLARLAGFPDPLRLEWALEAESIKDLAKGPIAITKDGVTVTLQLDDQAKPELSVKRGEKKLKSVPPAVKKKHKAIAELHDRAKELRAKSSRIKQSLENAMCRGDVIEGGELVKLMKHVILAPNLERVVMIGEGIAGYPDKGGKVLRDHRGKLEPIKKNEKLRIAHSADLLKLKNWNLWQRECFQVERVQPFKQVFRELYVPTKSEKSKTKSTRFSGQQIGPRQATALWNSRGWNTQEEVIKVFHDYEIMATVGFQYNSGTAAEIEGLTVDCVTFSKLDSFKPLKLSDVPPALFSEVMRDVDLVVSVAHRGEVDPEASESTVEMRTTLIRETCQLLDLKNVKFKPKHVVIKGYYGEYSLHLGSGGVQRIPGGALAIVAVQGQHRGRLFLPFADNDPKSAEIVSKVLLLAKDEEIMDPMILDQLGAPEKKRPKPIEILEKPKSKSGKAGAKKKPDAKGKSTKAKSSKTASSASGSKRRFEFAQGSSNKFWEIEISGDSVTTTWGRIGTGGQSKTKTFADETKAQAGYEKMIEAKTGKGYEEST